MCMSLQCPSSLLPDCKCKSITNCEWPTWWIINFQISKNNNNNISSSVLSLLTCPLASNNDSNVSVVDNRNGMMCASIVYDILQLLAFNSEKKINQSERTSHKKQLGAIIDSLSVWLTSFQSRLKFEVTTRSAFF